MSFKKVKVAKVVLTAVATTSVMAVTNPAEAVQQTEAEKFVKEAEKLAADLQKQVNYDSRVKLYPKDKLGLPNMKLYKKTGDAFQKAEKEVSKLKGKTKKTWKARLSAKVETPYKNATTYINVINAAKELDITNNQLSNALITGEWDDSVTEVQSQFRQDVKEFSRSISKVNGAATKKALRNSYVKKFMTTDQSIIYAIL